MTDFFISYISADDAWAQWIGHVLEDKGYSVIIQAWDFRAGSNFIVEMQRAAASAARTIMDSPRIYVLSSALCFFVPRRTNRYSVYVADFTRERWWARQGLNL